MKKILLVAPAVLSLALASAAQEAGGTALVNWVRYKDSDAKLSVMLPKLPLREDADDPCRELKSSVYFSYAEGVVYEFGVYTRSRRRGPFLFCYGEAKKFDQTIRERIVRLRDEKEPPAESVVDVDGRAAVLFKTSGSSRLMIAYENRWIELAVHHYANEKPDTDRFFKSLDWSAISGEEIGAGSGAILGDAGTVRTSVTPPTTDTKPVSVQPATAGTGNEAGVGNGRPLGTPEASDPYRVINQPRASYTDAARKKNVQGAVRLKITLLANGSVGSIIPLTTLPQGLTEQSIAAARRMVFLPKRVNNVPVSVVVTREYTFTIY